MKVCSEMFIDIANRDTEIILLLTYWFLKPAYFTGSALISVIFYGDNPSCMHISPIVFADTNRNKEKLKTFPTLPLKHLF